MSIFGSIMSKIFHHPSAAPAAATETAGATGTAPAPTAPAPAAPFDDGGATATAPTSQPAPAAAPANVDVGAVLTQMAAAKGGGGNYKVSIVDLLKLLDLDSSLDARRQLAQELNVHAGADGTAEENIALHKAVMQKLAENGGKVPDSLKG